MMEAEILSVADHAVEQAGITGYICVDKEGLCIAAKGQACQSLSGIIHQLAGLAAKIEDPLVRSASSKEAPVVRVDLDRYKMMIHSQESITTALISPQK